MIAEKMILLAENADVAEAVDEALNSTIFGTTGVWFLIGAALVFFMQCGFAMVESGFTRAKNAATSS